MLSPSSSTPCEYEYVFTIFCGDNLEPSDFPAQPERCFVSYSRDTGRFEYRNTTTRANSGCPDPLRLRLSINAFTRSFLPIIRHINTPFRLAMLTSQVPTEEPYAIELYVNPQKFKLAMCTVGEVPGEGVLLYAIGRHCETIYIDPPVSSSPTTTTTTTHSSRYSTRSKRVRLSHNSQTSLLTALIEHEDNGMGTEIKLRETIQIGSTDYSFYFPPWYTMCIARTTEVHHTSVVLRGGILCGGDSRNFCERALVVKRLITHSGPVEATRNGPFAFCRRHSSATLLVVSRELVHQWETVLRREDDSSGPIVILDRSSLRALSMDTLQHASIILCSHNLVRKEMGGYTNFEQQSIERRKSFTVNHPDRNLTHFWWRRVIIDEIVQFMGEISEVIVPMISELLVTNHMWGLSANTVDVPTLAFTLPLISTYVPPEIPVGLSLFTIHNKAVHHMPLEILEVQITNDYIVPVHLGVEQQLIYNRLAQSGCGAHRLIRFCTGQETASCFNLVTLEEALILGLQYHDSLQDQALVLEMNDEAENSNSDEEDEDDAENTGGDDEGDEDEEEDEDEEDEEEDEDDEDDEDYEDEDDEDDEEEGKEEDANEGESINLVTMNAAINHEVQHVAAMRNIATDDNEDDPIPDLDENLGEIAIRIAMMETSEQYEQRAKTFAESVEQLSSNTGDNICTICYSWKVDVLTTCGHVFCSTCVFRLQSDHSVCPYCRSCLANENVFHLKNLASDDQSGNKTPKYPKISTLVDIVKRSSGNTVVLLQWKNTAHFVQRQLVAAGLANTRILSGDTRHMYQTLEWFSNSNDNSENNHVLIVKVRKQRQMFIPNVSNAVFFHPLAAANILEKRHLEKRAISGMLSPTPTQLLNVHHLVTQETVESQMNFSET